MADFDRKDTIEELDRIASLYDLKNRLIDELYSIKQSEEEEINEKASPIIEGLEEYQLKARDNFGIETPVISSVCSVTPPPQKPVIKNAGTAVWIGALSGLCFLVSLTLYILLCIFKNNIADSLSWLFSLLIMGTAVCWFIFYRSVDQYIFWRNRQTKWDKQFRSYSESGDQERFLKECAEYEKRFFEVVEDCTKVYDEEQKKYEELQDQIHSEYVKKSGKTQSEFENVSEQLNAVTLIDSSLFDDAASISNLLRTQRADSLKEAINLAIEEKRKDKQERERRNEARRQQEILEEHAYQTRVHEQAMERSAELQAKLTREHAAVMEEQARAQTYETIRIRRELEKQKSTRKY